MNRNIVSALALMSMLTLLGGCNEETKPEKPAPQFGVVQLSKVYQESKLGRQGIDRFNEVQEKAVAAMSDIQAKVEKARADKNEAELARLEQEFQSRLYFLQNVIQQDQEHVMNVLQTEAKKAMEQCRAERNLFGIFQDDVVPVYSPEADMTNAVKTILDAGTASFGDLPSMEQPPLPEPENATPAEEPAAEAAPAEESAPAAETAQPEAAPAPEATSAAEVAQPAAE